MIAATTEEERMAIVVGFDGSEASKVALRWAVDEARLRGTKVVAVRAYENPVMPPVLDPYGAVPAIGPTTGVDSKLMRESVAQGLARAIAEAVPDTGGVEVEPQVVEDHPGFALVDASTGEDLLVVGSRGHGGFTGMLLGSVSQSVVHHARCPVVIVRPDAE
jgi:nucleotide-binding universal stress UspA family protein